MKPFMQYQYSQTEKPNCDILFVSRGRGYGHAIPDLAVAEQLISVEPSLNIKFASYAKGAEMFRLKQVQHIDLEQPENNKFVETIIACVHAIENCNPSIVVAHEEFAAIVAAEINNIPSVYMSAWFPPAGSIGAESLVYASALIIIENAGIFAVPAGVTVDPIYTGPILRPLQYDVRDRIRLRSKFGIDADELCIIVIPGGAASEEEFPIGDIVVGAYCSIDYKSKRLLWISSKDYEVLKKRFKNIGGFEAIPIHDPIEELMAAADLVITKGTRGTTLDAATVGVPSISLSIGNNWVDDVLVPRYRGNTALNARAVTPLILAQHIKNAISSEHKISPLRGSSSAVKRTAAAILQELEKSRRIPDTINCATGG
jgi:UDP-N-acetylglucosamine:LPS N-acetylglucosamine transferase